MNQKTYIHDHVKPSEENNIRKGPNQAFNLIWQIWPDIGYITCKRLNENDIWKDGEILLDTSSTCI